MIKKIILIIFCFFSPSTWTIDINTAAEQELADELYGIGKIKAKRLVEYRKKIGGFIAIEQIMEVKGIGPKIFQQNRDKLELSHPPTSSPSSTFTPSKPTPKDQSIIPPTKLPSFPTTTSLNLSPRLEKSPRLQPISWWWSALAMLPFFIGTLLIFIWAWLKDN
jgi:competence protein ComEA